MFPPSIVKSDQGKSPPENLDIFFNSSPSGLMFTDQQGKLLWWNNSFLTLLGLKDSEAKLHGDKISSILEKKVKNLDNLELRLYQIYREQQSVCLPIRLKNEKILEASMQWQSLYDGRKNCFWSVQDISEETAKVKYLQGFKDRYERALEGSKDGFWDWDLKENTFYISPRWKKILIPDTPQEQGKTLRSLWDLYLYIPSEEREAIEKKLGEYIKSNSNLFEVEFPVRTDHSHFLWLNMSAISLRDERKEIYRMYGSIRDITSRKISDTRRSLESFHDRLTGLANHISFKRKLAETLKVRSKRKLEREQGYTFSVLFLRISRLSIINENFGPDYGDQVIKEISHRLQQFLRQEDFLARFEGNTFAMILQNVSNEKEITIFAKRIQERLHEVLEINEQNFFIGSKMGAILPPPQYAKTEDILRECTKALGQAKKENRDLCILPGTGLKGKKGDLDFFFFNDLSCQALENDQFTLYFQPIIDLRTAKVKSCEALLRLKNLELTEEKKAIFNLPGLMHAAEKSGQIIKIGRFVLEKVHEFAQELEYGGFKDCEIKVNISPHQLKQENFCDELEEIFNPPSLKAGRVCLEITENVFINYDKELEKKLRRLKDLGFQLALDDFGTGYASFASLRDLPIDVVKLDRSFLKRALHSEKDGALLASMIVMGHSLSLQVIAEGVENKEQLEFLKNFECDCAQGFLFSPAIPSAKFIDYLTQYKDSVQDYLPSPESKEKDSALSKRA